MADDGTAGHGFVMGALSGGAANTASGGKATSSAGTTFPLIEGGAPGAGGGTASIGVLPRGGSVGIITAPLGSGGATATSSTPASGGYLSTTSSFAKCFDFNDSVENWRKNYASAFLLDDSTVRDAPAAQALLENTTADWTASVGTVNGYGGIPGFVQLTIPFATTQSTYQGLTYAYLPSPPLQLRGKTIHAFVKLISGMTVSDPSHPSGAKLIVKSGPDWFYGDGGWVNLSKNEWTELMLDVSNPAKVDASKDAALFDPDDIREISVDFDTSGSATSVETPGVVWLDHVCY
jgi:hypothetical protein